jgi:hypothetical protein
MAAILGPRDGPRKRLPTSCTTLLAVRKYLFLGENSVDLWRSEASWLVLGERFFVLFCWRNNGFA